MDKPPEAIVLFAEMSVSGTVPNFFVYGEAPRQLGLGFVHCETVMARKNLHFGRVEPHRHDRLAQITFWTSGRGSYLIEDELLDFSAPAISFIPSGVVHGFNVEPEETDAIVVSIAEGAVAAAAADNRLPLAAPVMIRSGVQTPVWDRIERLMRLILDEYAQEQTPRETVLMPLISAALAQISILSNSRAPSAPPPLSERLRQAVDRHFRDNWSVVDYVAALGTTPHLLAKACEAAFGVPVKELAAQRRLLEAKRLLLFTVRSVEDISYEVGIQDPAYFSRAFRKRTGQPPGEWRKAQTDLLGAVLEPVGNGAGETHAGRTRAAGMGEIR